MQVTINIDDKLVRRIFTQHGIVGKDAYELLKRRLQAALEEVAIDEIEAFAIEMEDEAD